MESFLDIRSHGFVRVGLIIPRVHLGDPRRNAESHLELLRKVSSQGAMYVLCPELGLTGYSCQDLFFQERLLLEALEALEILLRETADWKDMLISVGIPLRFGSGIYNCAVSFCGGEIKGIVPKTFLPEYREYWERRWFACASDASFTEVTLLGQRIPFGNRLLFQHVAYPDFIIHTQICEDGWLRHSPSGEAALADATVLANLSASNTTLGKSEFRKRVLGEASSALDLAVQMYASAGLGESSTDLSWDGQGFICQRGETLCETPRFSLEPTCLVQDVHIRMLITDRCMQGSFRDSASRMRHRLKNGEFDFQRIPFGEPERPMGTIFNHFRYDISPHPFIPSSTEALNHRCEEVFNTQATALVRRLIDAPKRKIILGLSGGLDSTQALLVAVRAMDILVRPRTEIVCITMPGFGTTKRTKNNAVLLAEALGVTIRTVPIVSQEEDSSSGIAEKLLDLVGHDGVTEDLTFENAQAWCRKMVELTTGAKEGGMVLGTSDLSELALGYCTMFGDHASHYGVNSGVAKTLIRFLVQWAIKNVFGSEQSVGNVLTDILDTPMSAELLSPAGDQIVQVTQDRIGPYELHDFTLYWGVRFGICPRTIVRLALQAFRKRYSLEEVVKWQRLFWQRFFTSQYKRNCLPDGPKIGLVCLSPRGDWRMPSDAHATAWLRDLDDIEL